MPSRAPCRSKQALLRGLKPNLSSQQKTLCGVCPTRCIYCDIWKLATLVAARVPLSQRLTSSSNKLHRSSSNASNSSSSSSGSYEYVRSERLIEAQFQTQRARLASLMSICTVEGAEECDGLRLAHDRCLGSVADLMEQERMLEDRMARENAGRRRSSIGRRMSRDCGSSQNCRPESRRPSLVGMAN